MSTTATPLDFIVADPLGNLALLPQSWVTDELKKSEERVSQIESKYRTTLETAQSDVANVQGLLCDGTECETTGKRTMQNTKTNEQLDVFCLPNGPCVASKGDKVDFLFPRANGTYVRQSDEFATAHKAWMDGHRCDNPNQVGGTLFGTTAYFNRQCPAGGDGKSEATCKAISDPAGNKWCTWTPNPAPEPVASDYETTYTLVAPSPAPQPVAPVAPSPAQ